MSMKRISVFGSTGSIGRQTLDVCAMHPGLFRTGTLVFGGNSELGCKQIREFRPDTVGVFSEHAAQIVRREFPGLRVVSGADVWELAASSDDDTVVNGVSGFNGVFPLLHAMRAGKTTALANKESVVCAGGLVRKAMEEGGGCILPVDSEQSAIFQCLACGRKEQVKRLILTASGGAFRDTPECELPSVTPEMAMKHPNWSMGRKITIDSATMFNKGLEIMEAAFLFDTDAEHISVLIHPQSVVHSMVEFTDGSVMAQLAVPDMRLAIQYALTYPERVESPASRLDLAALSGLTFRRPDEARYPAVRMAYEALKAGGTAPIAYNSGNEAAVERFIAGDLRFTEIAPCVEYAMEHIERGNVNSMDELLHYDAEARRLARAFRPVR